LDVIELPVPESIGRDVGSLERVLHEVENLLGENVFVITVPVGHQQPIVVGVEEPVAGAFRPVIVRSAPTDVAQELRLIVAVEVNLVVDAIRRIARLGKTRAASD
jgi:hypothetical protein